VRSPRGDNGRCTGKHGAACWPERAVVAVCVHCVNVRLSMHVCVCVLGLVDVYTYIDVRVCAGECTYMCTCLHACAPHLLVLFVASLRMLAHALQVQARKRVRGM